MTHDRVRRQAERAIVRLCHAGIDSRTLRLEVLRQLRKVVPADALFCATVDPATLLFTGSVVEEIPEHATQAFLANEFFQDDVNKFAELARAARPVRGLYEATRGAPTESARYREILAPLGFGDELRAALRVGSTTWGVVCLHRSLAHPGFTTEDAAFLERVSSHFAEGLRTALLVESAAPRAFEGPGLVVLAEDYSVISATENAARWLDELGDSPRRDEPPQAIRAVAARLEAIERAGIATPGLLPRARAQTRSGRWLLLHAARLFGGAERQVAVIVEPASPAEVAPLIMQAYGLTDREAQVAELVLRGLSTSEIVGALSITPLTVQQHLKAVFDKTGVHSRRELVARIFAQQYLPRMLGSADS